MPPVDCGVVLVVTIQPRSLVVEAAREVVYQLCQVLCQYVVPPVSLLIFITGVLPWVETVRLQFFFFSFDLLSVGVEICEAETVTFNNPPRQLSISGLGLTFDQLYNTPILGTSIGPAGGMSTGSLGFFVKFCHQGEIVPLGVTCHHVVAPGRCMPFRLLSSYPVERCPWLTG